MANKLKEFFEVDDSRSQVYQDFTSRYEQDPTQLSDSEVLQYYSELANFLDDQDMDKVHEATFGQLSADEQRGLAQHFQYASRDPMRSFQGYPQGTNFNLVAQPRRLGRMARNAAHDDPALLEELIGPDAPLTATAVKLAMAGTTAALAGRYLSKQAADPAQTPTLAEQD